MDIQALQANCQQEDGRAWGSTAPGSEAPLSSTQADAGTSAPVEQRALPAPTMGAFQPIGRGDDNIPGVRNQEVFQGTNGTHPRDAHEEMLEPEAKKLRRKLNNRESARRSRQKKADEISRLQELVSQKDGELEQSKRSIAVLQMQVRLLMAKVTELGGSMASEVGGSINEPVVEQAVSAPATEPQPVAQAPAGGAQVPPEAQAAAGVLGSVEQPEQN